MLLWRLATPFAPHRINRSIHLSTCHSSDRSIHLPIPSHPTTPPNRTAEGGDKANTVAALAEGPAPEHRMLPPLSHGWAYEGGNAGRGGRKEEVGSLEGGRRVPDIAREQAVAGEGKEPEHRMLPPLSHGWAYEGGNSGRGGRKEEVDTQEGEKAAAAANDAGKL